MTERAGASLVDAIWRELVDCVVQRLRSRKEVVELHRQTFTKLFMIEPI